MREIRTIKSADLFPFISEIIEQGQSTRIAVKGSSMYPFLRDSVDSVELAKGCFDSLIKGDIVLIQRTDGTYVMHRVLRKAKDFFYMVGDAQQWVEGPIFSNQLVAVVQGVWRKDKRIDCNNLSWRFLSWWWLLLRPYRYIILRVYRKIRQLI